MDQMDKEVNVVFTKTDKCESQEVLRRLIEMKEHVAKFEKAQSLFHLTGSQ